VPDALLSCSHGALMRRIPHTARQPAHHTHTQVNTPHTRKETYVHVHTTGTPQRRMARARMATARSTLRSFQGLIESIPNMLIRDDISSRFVTRFVWGAACVGLPAVVVFSLCLPLSAPSRRVTPFCPHLHVEMNKVFVCGDEQRAHLKTCSSQKVFISTNKHLVHLQKQSTCSSRQTNSLHLNNQLAHVNKQSSSQQSTCSCQQAPCSSQQTINVLISTCSPH